MTLYEQLDADFQRILLEMREVATDLQRITRESDALINDLTHTVAKERIVWTGSSPSSSTF